MPESTQARRRSRESDSAADGQDAPRDQRNEQLDEDVACCLADIDEVLAEAETETERDRALREFSEIRRSDGSEEDEERKLAVWQATYAHLGLRVGRSCCGEPFVFDEHEYRRVSGT